ncbi:hypothetical protein [Psychrobacter sp. TWP2-1-2]|uniref:hypothetical protein n=1 Tax=Psychrobacter sp. TWP2-1-2 TaxID=2804623 RepID=UPI003CFA9C65
MNSTKSSVLPTLRGFHYQVLLGIEKCFELNAGQSIWFESDGDISIRGNELENNEQIESKHYDQMDVLTDGHANFWNTLNNWLKDDFDHTQYAFLILHTTQPTSKTSQLYGWNSKTPDEKLGIISSIYDKRTDAEKTKKDAKGVLKFQQAIFDSNNKIIKDILGKMLINDSADNIDNLKLKLINKPLGIPDDNIDQYFEGIVGWVYEKMGEDSWSINQHDFKDKLEELTSKYSRGKFSFPPFTGELATDIDLLKHNEYLFVQKIKDIEHYDEIPEAVGNYAEFTNILLEESVRSPKYREITKTYKSNLIRKFKRKHQNSSLLHPNHSRIDCAKILYNEFIDEPAEQVQECEMTPKPYKNGLIHNSMDDENDGLKWEID